MWYGKGPGVDRSGDAFRHANLHGVGRNGGVIAAAGDDPAAKSSTLPHGSEVALYDAGMPVLTPGTPQEVLDLGRHGYELSRYSGCWVGLKIVTAVADGFAEARVDPDRIQPTLPELIVDGAPWVFSQRPRLFLPDTLELEAELYSHRHDAARAYQAANGLNVMEVDPTDAWITIAAPGRTYRELRQALGELGFPSDDDVAAAGIRLVRLGMIFPLDGDVVRHAVRGVDELLVVEEKRSFVESQILEILYAHHERPAVLGKRDEAGQPLVPADGELNAERLAPILRSRLGRRLTVTPEPVRRELLTLTLPARYAGPRSAAAAPTTGPPSRHRAPRSSAPVSAATQWSSGPTAGRSVQPDGRRGCAVARPGTVHRRTPLGAERRRRHLLPLRLARRPGAVAAGVSITFKLLYNGTVAMTGGQDPAGKQGVEQVVASMRAPRAWSARSS